MLSCSKLLPAYLKCGSDLNLSFFGPFIQKTNKLIGARPGPPLSYLGETSIKQLPKFTGFLMLTIYFDSDYMTKIVYYSVQLMQDHSSRKLCSKVLTKKLIFISYKNNSESLREMREYNDQKIPLRLSNRFGRYE